MAEVLEFNQMFYTNFEPKVKNRFVLEIDGIPAYLVRGAKRPQIDFENIEMPHINLVRNIKGRGKWADMEVTLYDPIVPSGAQAVMEWVRLSHESLTGRDGYAEFYKKNLDLKVLGPVGDVIELWKIKGAYIKSANFNDLSWTEAAAALEITLTLAIDYAVLEY